jgi:isochorismate synthase
MPALSSAPAGLQRPHAQLASRFCAAAHALGMPAACWRMPGARVQHFIADTSGRMDWRRPALEDLPDGFLAAPFANPKGHAHYLQAHVQYQWDEQRGIGRLQQALAPEWQAGIGAFLAEWAKPAGGEGPSFFLGPAPDGGTATREGFEELVGLGMQAIEQGRFQKVVLSRQEAVPLSLPIDPAQVFLALCERYPNAFVSLLSSAETGTWLGASPEILVSMNAEGLFRTIALAGTQARSSFETLADATWRQKEIEEQALVSRYIINCFKKIRLREFEEVGPRTVQAGNLIHLRTDFTVNTQEVPFPGLATAMLELLHPTSAVCGMPKDASMAFIQEREGYDRQLYSGFLGPVGMGNGAHLFVNLRCMRLLPDMAWLYAGAGITQDSRPEKEWQETAMKMEVMRQALQGL